MKKLNATEPSVAPELSSLASQGQDLLKSHVDSYTRTDGVTVRAHDDKRVAAQSKTGGGLGTHKVGDSVSYQGDRGTRTGKVKGERDGKVIVEHKAGYAELKHHSELTAAGGESKAEQSPSIGAQHAALKASSKPGDMDHETNQIAAGYMATGDHKSLKQHLQGADTAARDHVLDHIHPDHWEGLGYNALNKERSVKQYDAKFGAKPAAAPKAKAKVPAAAKPDVATGPAEGEVGAEEHKTYGKYFKKGDKVKDLRGNTHEVLSHVGPVVQTDSGGSFHPTKLNHVDDTKADAGKPATGKTMAKALLFTSPAQVDELQALAKSHTKKD